MAGKATYLGGSWNAGTSSNQSQLAFNFRNRLSTSPYIACRIYWCNGLHNVSSFLQIELLFFAVCTAQIFSITAAEQLQPTSELTASSLKAVRDGVGSSPPSFASPAVLESPSKGPTSRPDVLGLGVSVGLSGASLMGVAGRDSVWAVCERSCGVPMPHVASESCGSAISRSG